MDIQRTVSLYQSESTLLSDANYYKYIFKKTEKIVCAVFYILDQTHKSHDSLVAKSFEVAAKDALDVALSTLSLPAHAASRELGVLVRALLALQSNVRLAHASGMIAADALDLLVFDIDNVLRGLRQYLALDRDRMPELNATEEASAPSMPRSAPPRARVERDRVAPSSSVAATASKGQVSDRQRAIKDILATQGQSTIKDISTRIKDCSEKTIQRELNSLIADGLVRKEGERRWSRYALA